MPTNSPTTKPCTICDSTHTIPGPFYAPDAITCMDCGYSVPSQPTPIPVPIPTPPALPVPPVGGFTSLEEMQSHLAAMQKHGKGLLSNLATKPKGTKQVVREVPDNLVMLVVHRYSRAGEHWQAVLSDAKHEKEYRNTNVLVWVHTHEFNSECSNKCKEL